MVGVLLVFILLVGVGAVALVLVRSMAVGDGKRPDGVQCGACGYDGRGSASMTCPECGADYRAVGLIPPGYRSHAWYRTPLLLLLWTVGVLVGSGALWGLLAATVVPKVALVSTSMTWSGSSASRSGGLVSSAVLDASLQWTFVPIASKTAQPVGMPATVLLNLTDGTTVTVRSEVDPLAGPRYWREDQGPGSATTGVLNAAALEALIATGGEALAASDRLKLADIEAGVVAAMQSPLATSGQGGGGWSRSRSSSGGGGSGFASSTSSQSSGVREAARAGSLFTLTMVVLWGWGSWRIVSGRGRGTGGGASSVASTAGARGAVVLAVAAVVVLLLVALMIV